ncbi:hypothetical protein VTI74DRAFT_5329 [Chaetomium olivicolor]
MEDNFFDGTLDGSPDDQSFTNLVLPLPSSSSPLRQQASPVHPLPSRLEPPVILSPISRHGPGNPSLFFGNGESQSLRHGPPGAGLVPGPTRPGAFNRPTPATPQHPEPCRLNASPRTLTDTDPPPSRLDSPALRAPTHPTTSAAFGSRRNPYPSNPSTPHLQNQKTTSTSCQPSRGEIFYGERASHGLSHVQTHPQRPYHASSADGIIRTSSPCDRATLHRGSDNPSSGSLTSIRLLSTMSTNARPKRTIRPGDLTMPSAPSQAGPSSGSARATRSASRPSSSSNKRKREADKEDDLFGGDAFAAEQVVDLVDKDDIPDEVVNSQKEADKKYVKLSKYDCAICMDSVTNLTVTHCGHLFCSECLHSALNIDPSRRICPICRQKIDALPLSGKYSNRARGFYALELKLMTRRTLGKSNTPQASPPGV